MAGASEEIVPGVTTAAVVRDPDITAGGQFAVIQSVAPLIGVDVRAASARPRRRDCYIGVLIRWPVCFSTVGVRS
jgi:hypothetical protein